MTVYNNNVTYRIVRVYIVVMKNDVIHQSWSLPILSESSFSLQGELVVHSQEHLLTTVREGFFRNNTIQCLKHCNTSCMSMTISLWGPFEIKLQGILNYFMVNTFENVIRQAGRSKQYLLVSCTCICFDRRTRTHCWPLSPQKQAKTAGCLLGAFQAYMIQNLSIRQIVAWAQNHRNKS